MWGLIIIIVCVAFLVWWLGKKELCKHEFNYPKDMKQTGYDSGKYDPYFHKRVMCPCCKCHEIFFAHCGVDLPGKLIREVKV